MLGKHAKVKVKKDRNFKFWKFWKKDATKDAEAQVVDAEGKPGKSGKKIKKEMTPEKKKKLLIILGAILVLLIVGGVIGCQAFLNWTPMRGDGVKPSTDETDEKIAIRIPGEGDFATIYKDSKRINIMVIGNTPQNLTDSLMLVSFDPDTKMMDLISIPRDTYFPREGISPGGTSRINTVYAFTKDPVAVCQAVHEVLLGIPINYYAMVNYDGIVKIVDAIGGVPMNVKQDMVYTAVDLKIDIKAGEQILDGDHAVQFLRYRKGYADADIGRISAQQQFVRNAVDAALDSDLISLAKVVIDNVDSDLSVRAMLKIVKESKGMKAGAVKGYSIPGKGEMIEHASVWIRADDTVIRDILAVVYTGKPISTDAEIKESVYSKYYKELREAKAAQEAAANAANNPETTDGTDANGTDANGTGTDGSGN